jgi:hypothetical protein
MTGISVRRASATVQRYDISDVGGWSGRNEGPDDANGVPATIGFTYTAENDPNKLLGREGGCTSKVSLQDSHLPEVTDLLSETASSRDGGAAIECYPNPWTDTRR